MKRYNVELIRHGKDYRAQMRVEPRHMPPLAMQEAVFFAFFGLKINTYAEYAPITINNMNRADMISDPVKMNNAYIHMRGEKLRVQASA